MSGQTLCLSVGNFFSQCNWQGYIRRLEQQLYTQALSKAVGVAAPVKQSSWQCLLVKDFFSRYDWQGYSTPVEEVEAKPSLAEAVGVKVSQLKQQGQSLQCLAVADFFSRYDWQGQPLQWQSTQPSSAVREEATPELPPPNPLQCLPVQEFFGRCDWQGSVAEPEELITVEPDSSLSELASELMADYQPSQGSAQTWQCQSVQAFFSKSNWKGTRSPRRRQQIRSDCSTSPFTLPMGEFFDRFFWEGKPQIAAPPKQKASSEFTQARSPDLKVTNLSALF